ncbi:hypothetical protein R6138_04584 [Ralstonia thomasii]|nr:hypothetical protein R6138_04584 [Ralstonia sp. LMG 18095]
MVLRALCAAANGKRVIIVTPQAAMRDHVLRMLREYGLDSQARVSCITLGTVGCGYLRGLRSDKVAVFFDHTCADRPMSDVVCREWGYAIDAGLLA